MTLVGFGSRLNEEAKKQQLYSNILEVLMSIIEKECGENGHFFISVHISITDLIR